VPETGPVLIAGNHISYIDPFAHAHLVVKRHRRPRFLGKRDLFEVPVLGWAMDNARQIPVDRSTPSDPAPLEQAERALAEGECVVVYPEGTVTTDPEFLPMRGKTGTVRLSLATGVPITPIAVWGSQAVWQKSGRGSLKFARPIFVRAGEPIDLSAYRDQANDGQVLRKLTDELMAELTRLVEGLRAEYPKRWAAG
jgi:1-acyl-sn-glycerol-3-phosphate acyltransferase